MFVKSRSDWYSLDWSGAEHYQYCCQWMEKLSLCLCSHSGPTIQAILLQAVEKWTTGWNVSQSARNVNKMCFYVLIKQSCCIGQKSDIWLVVISPCSTETNVGWSGKLNGHLMASCVTYIRTKNYQNLVIGFQVTVENVGDAFLGHSVYPCLYVSFSKAHKSTVWLARHLPQNRDVFMTLGGSGSLNLWK